MLLLSASIGIIVIILFTLYKNVKQVPPGPWGLPLLGYYPFIGSIPTNQFSQLADKYGEIMTVNFFGENYYYLNNLQVVKEVIIKQTNFTSDRPVHFNKNSPFAFVLGKNSLITSSGEAWKIQHKFMLSKLSELGMGKDEINQKISALCENVVQFLKNTNECETDIYEILTNFTSNVISMMLFNRSYAFDDPEYIRLRDDVREFFMCCPGIDGTLSGDLFYFWYTMKADYFKRGNTLRIRCLEYFASIIEQRIKIKNNGLRENSDLLDFLVEKHIENAKYFTIEAIASNCFVYFTGGTETTSSTLYHAINLMILYPEIQARVQQEIETVFGTERPVSYKERHLLPYTQAVIQEVQRYVCLIPFGITHCTSKQLTVGRYVIPEKSNLIINFWKITRDNEQFNNPDNFDPNNFLTENGEFVRKDANMPFSAGKRICIGASLASMELFICFVTLMQKFTWKPPKGETVKREIFEGEARVLRNFKCIASNRH